MTDTDGNMPSATVSSTEHVCGLIIDTSGCGGIQEALSESIEAQVAFADSNIVELQSLNDLAKAGIDGSNNVMGGLPYYHVKTFFALAGNGQRLFLAFANFSEDTEASLISKMQYASGGIIYQIGVWTSKAFCDSSYKVVSGGILAKCQAQAELIGGTVGVTNYEGNSPAVILVQAPPLNAVVCDYTKLPDISALGFEKVACLIGQADSEEVSNVQLGLFEITNDMPVVGCIGAALGVLAIAPVNKNIGWTGGYNLSAVMNGAELGFGNLDSDSGGWEADADRTNIKTLTYTQRNNCLHKKGYIFLTNYEGLENSVFFSSDHTLACDSDYRTLSRCRVMFKSRRAVRIALLGWVNEDWNVDASTGCLATADIQMIKNRVLEAIDKNMREPVSKASQISGRAVYIDPGQNILENDSLEISYCLVPKGVSTGIYVTEGFTNSIE